MSFANLHQNLRIFINLRKPSQLSQFSQSSLFFNLSIFPRFSKNEYLLQSFIIFHKYSILSRFVDPRPAPLAGPWPLSRLAAGPLDPWHPSPVSPVTPIRLPAPWSLAPAPRVPGGPAPCSLAHCPAPGPLSPGPLALALGQRFKDTGGRGIAIIGTLWILSYVFLTNDIQLLAQSSLRSNREQWKQRKPHKIKTANANTQPYVLACEAACEHLGDTPTKQRKETTQLIQNS